MAVDFSSEDRNGCEESECGSNQVFGPCPAILLGNLDLGRLGDDLGGELLALIDEDGVRLESLLLVGIWRIVSLESVACSLDECVELGEKIRG